MSAGGKRVGGFSESAVILPYVAHPTSDGLDPAARFLLDSLIVQPRVARRNDVLYFTLRQWRASVKSYQIEALRTLKKSPPPRFVSAVAADIAEALAAMFGGDLYKVVVPIPCSRSHPESCLSSLIAEKLAAMLHLISVRALAIDTAAGSSHPKANLGRVTMRALGSLPGAALVVDDVATSGVHLEEAVHLLRQSGQSIFALAWIGGRQGVRAGD